MREQVLRRIFRLVTIPEEELEQVEQAEEIEFPHGTLIIKPIRRIRSTDASLLYIVDG